MKQEDPLKKLSQYRKTLKPDDSVAASQMISNSISALMMYANRGEKYAFEQIHHHAIELCRCLQGNGFRREAKDIWNDLIKTSASWPVELSAEASIQKQELEKFNKLPLGKSSLFKKNEAGKRGRPIDYNENKPAFIAKVLVEKIMVIQRCISNYNTQQYWVMFYTAKFHILEQLNSQSNVEEIEAVMLDAENRVSYHSAMASSCSDYPVNSEWANYYKIEESLIRDIRKLPPFSKSSLKKWHYVICKYVVDCPNTREIYLPDDWKDDWEHQCHKHQKSMLAYFRQQLEKGLESTANY